METISFIILTWNSEKYLPRCLESVTGKCKEEGIDYEIIIIDNGSSDATCSILDAYKLDLPDQVHLIYLDSNRGTTYTRNLGLKKAKGQYIFILDSDTEFDQGSLKEVLRILALNEQIGIIAPRLLLPDGSIQNSVKRFPTFWHKIMKIPKILFGTRIADADFYKTFPFEEEVFVDSAISACWFLRRELLEDVGLLDESIFYSPEDLDYCFRVREKGKGILYSPYFTILHHTQQISHKRPFSKVSLSHFAGLLYYYRKHGGWISSPALKNVFDMRVDE